MLFCCTDSMSNYINSQHHINFVDTICVMYLVGENVLDNSLPNVKLTLIVLGHFLVSAKLFI